MKIKVYLLAVLLSLVSAMASAASDRNYYVVDTAIKQRFDIYNDGKNTYIEAIPGLIVKGATVDGSYFIVFGVPNSIAAQLNGKSITLTRGVAPKPDAPTQLISKPPVTGATQANAASKAGVMDSKNAVAAAATQLAPAELPPVSVLRSWAMKPSHLSLHQLIEDWAAKVDYEVTFKTRDFRLDVKSEKVISTGDFWAALTLLGEAYRNSDAPFQIQPTAFKQIVILPMNAPKNKIEQTNFEVLN